MTSLTAASSPVPFLILRMPSPLLPRGLMTQVPVGRDTAIGLGRAATGVIPCPRPHAAEFHPRRHRRWPRSFLAAA